MVGSAGALRIIVLLVVLPKDSMQGTLLADLLLPALFGVLSIIILLIVRALPVLLHGLHVACWYYAVQQAYFFQVDRTSNHRPCSASERAQPWPHALLGGVLQ